MAICTTTLDITITLVIAIVNPFADIFTIADFAIWFIIFFSISILLKKVVLVDQS